MLTKCIVCEQRKKDEQCEGFSNKETWAVALHLDNVKWLQDAYRLHKNDVIRDYKLRAHTAQFAERLKNMLENWREDFFRLAASGCYNSLNARQQKELCEMFNDIGSLWRVDWKELAEHLLKD